MAKTIEELESRLNNFPGDNPSRWRLVKLLSQNLLEPDFLAYYTANIYMLGNGLWPYSFYADDRRIIRWKWLKENVAIHKPYSSCYYLCEPFYSMLNYIPGYLEYDTTRKAAEIRLGLAILNHACQHM